MGFFEGERWDNAGRNLGLFLQDLLPPDVSRDWMHVVTEALVETVVMAYAGTFLGLVVALPMAALATRPLVGWPVSVFFRVLLATLRTIPSLLWALIFVVMVGLGPVPGILGLAAYTVGYLGKLYYETFEGVDPEILEAVRATGAGRVALVRHVVLPESANEILSQLLFIFEYNVRASTILGVVGAGGIGVPLFSAVARLEYDQMATAILLMLVVVLAIDWASAALRRRFLLPAHAGGAG